MVSCQPQCPIRKVFSCCSGDSLTLNAVEPQSCAILSRAGSQLVHTPANNDKYMAPKILTCTSDTLTVTIQAAPKIPFRLWGRSRGLLSFCSRSL